MKTLKCLGTFSFLFICLFTFAQTKIKNAKTEAIKVWGNCGMCKSHIEKAAKAGGATYAVWNKDSKLLNIRYESSKTNSRQIQQKIAAAGYDTKDYTGDAKAYEELDECCKYDRKADASKEKAKQ
jgi:mercuric ion binding protein